MSRGFHSKGIRREDHFNIASGMGLSTFFSALRQKR
jgi:hypothetical protein